MLRKITPQITMRCRVCFSLLEKKTITVSLQLFFFRIGYDYFKLFSMICQCIHFISRSINFVAQHLNTNNFFSSSIPCRVIFTLNYLLLRSWIICISFIITICLNLQFQLSHHRKFDSHKNFRFFFVQNQGLEHVYVWFEKKFNRTNSNWQKLITFNFSNVTESNVSNVTKLKDDVDMCAKISILNINFYQIWSSYLLIQVIQMHTYR